MEPSRKRRRLSDPDADLNERRAQNDFRLKSIFESIFEKYGKDFDGIGDEIDMRTGEIIVDNGHILGMRNERDAGDVQSSEDGYESGYSSEEDEDDVGSDDYDHEAFAAPVGASTTASSYVPGPADFLEDADSLIRDVGELNESISKQATATEGKLLAYDSDEDELASKEYSWLSPRKIRSIAHDRWRLHELEYVDREATDPAWCVSPLPEIRSSYKTPPKPRGATFENPQVDYDSEDADTSIWALQERKPRGRPSLAAFREGLDHSEQLERVPLTQEEEETNHATHEVSGEHVPIESYLDSPFLPQGSGLSKLEIVTIIRRSRCVEQLRKNRIPTVFIDSDLPVDKPTEHTLKTGIFQSTTVHDSLSEIPAEAQISQDEATASTTVSSMPSIPAANPTAPPMVQSRLSLLEALVKEQSLIIPLIISQDAAYRSLLTAPTLAMVSNQPDPLYHPDFSSDESFPSDFDRGRFPAQRRRRGPTSDGYFPPESDRGRFPAQRRRRGNKSYTPGKRSTSSSNYRADVGIASASSLQESQSESIGTSEDDVHDASNHKIIDQYSPSRHPAVQVVIPSTAQSQVPDNILHVINAEACHNSLDHSRHTNSPDSNKEENTQKSLCQEGELTLDKTAPVPLQSALNANVADVDSEDELSSPAVHSMTRIPTRRHFEQNHRHSDKRDSSFSGVPSPQARNKFGLPAWTPVRHHRNIRSPAIGRGLSIDLPLRDSRTPKTQKSKVVQPGIADSFESISIATIGDYSEDELA